MFNVGDEVIVVRAAHFLPEGASCVISRVYYSNIVGEWFVDVILGGFYSEGWFHDRFELPADGKTAVERKIKRMYERQHRKTGLSCFQV